MFSLSVEDAVFQRKIQKQLKRIDGCLRSTVEDLASDLGQQILVSDDEEVDSFTLDIRKLLPFALQTTFRQNIKPKRIKPLIPTSSILLDLLDDDHDPSIITSSQDTFVSTSTLSDDETLQLDSPLVPASPASSIQGGDLCDSPILSMCSFSLESPPPVALPLELEDTGGVTRDSDLDLDLDLDANADYGARDAGVNTADGDEQMDFGGGDWIELDFPHSEDRLTVGGDLGTHSPNLITEAEDSLLWWDEDSEVAQGKVNEADVGMSGFGDGEVLLLDLD